MSAQILLIGLSFLATLFTIIGVFFAYIIIFRKIPEPNKPLSKKFLVFFTKFNLYYFLRHCRYVFRRSGRCNKISI